MSDFSFIPPTSVVTIPGAHASAAFTSKTSEVFKEEHNIAPIIINDKMKYIPWGGDNQIPYNIIDLIESDETLSTCQMFNAEVCYGSGLVYNTEQATEQVRSEVDDFTSDNDLASYFLGVCQDFKHFVFCVSVIILNEDASRIVRIVRKQACYVRFAPVDKSGVIPYILYANWCNRSVRRTSSASNYSIHKRRSRICRHAPRNTRSSLSSHESPRPTTRIIPYRTTQLSSRASGTISSSSSAWQRKRSFATPRP
ncbi:hypothetical protein [Leyella stercorea]|uniref:hypothetical protein n=1 Tax=Leyella stercorea TaxID=363265 RepID=UPI00242E39D1|nr:hypothetical protein [Leyella stercorea]